MALGNWYARRLSGLEGPALLLVTPILAAEATVFLVAFSRDPRADAAAFLAKSHELSFVLAGLASVAYAATFSLLLVWLAAACKWRPARILLVAGASLLAFLPALSAALYVARGGFLSRELLSEGIALLGTDRTASAATILGFLLGCGLMGGGLSALVVRSLGPSPDPGRIARGSPAPISLGSVLIALLLFGAASIAVWVEPGAAPAFRTDLHASSSLLSGHWLVHRALVPADRKADLGGARGKSATRRPLPTLGAYLASLGGRENLRRPNVVIVMLEGIPVQHLGTFGYPRPVSPELDSLARRSVSFDRAWSISNESKNGQTSILASVLPMRGGMNDFVRGSLDFPRVLCWDVFRALGYRTAFISTQDETWLGMKRFQLLGKEPPDVYLHAPDFEGGEMIPGGYPNRDEETVNRSVFRHLEVMSRESRPFLLVVNYQRTHFPYRLPRWRSPRFVPLAPLGDSIRAWRAEDLPLARNNFDSAVAYVDEQVGALSRELQTLGLADKTLLAVISDHGQGFDVGLQPVSQSIEDEYVHVPFLLSLPGVLEPRRVSQDVSTIDLLPTILGVIGAPPCPAWQGSDLLSSRAAGPAGRPVLVGSIVWEMRWRALAGDVEVDVDFLARRWEARRRGTLRSGSAPLADPTVGEPLMRWLVDIFFSQQAYYDSPADRHSYLPPEIAPAPR